ncbi:MAG: rhodanese-like domain-containing protein [Woeseia sp.]|jgi:rhodanese-related sulfurtransferase|nr:rhodanese-like domain-containing protein [Woeseia sp.]MBT6211896.1 rhodanese-like domain-containing protein [Woeseia sp.]
MSLLPSDLVGHAKQAIQEIEPLALGKHLDDNPVVIDVREPDEFARGAIPGAVNIPRGVLEFELKQHPVLNCEPHPVVVMPEQPIYLYCRSGGRSALAAASLQTMGFANVWSLAGGYCAWESQGHPVSIVA